MRSTARCATCERWITVATTWIEDLERQPQCLQQVWSAFHCVPSVVQSMPPPLYRRRPVCSISHPRLHQSVEIAQKRSLHCWGMVQIQQLFGARSALVVQKKHFLLLDAVV